MKFVAAYITCKDESEARKIGQLLVEQRLAGCANIIPKIKSIYWWDGKIQNGQESLVISKVLAANRKQITKMVKKNHSYKVPCINFLSVEIGNPDYRKWLEKETKK